MGVHQSFKRSSTRYRVVRRMIVAGFAAIALGAVSGATTNAAAGAMTLSPNVGPPTAHVQVTGTGFDASESVMLSFDSGPALVTAAQAGSFRATVVVPASAVPGRHWFTAIGMTSGTSAQAAFVVRSNWPQFHNSPNHRGWSQHENVHSRRNASKLAVNWSITTGGRVETGPAVVRGMVYVHSEDGLYAADAATGVVRWRVATRGLPTSPAVAHGVVYSAASALEARNARTGQLIWSVPVDINYHSSPTVVDGVVYVGSLHHVYALKARTGRMLWRFRIPGVAYSTPAVANGKLYVQSWTDGTIYALSADTGAKLWSVDPANGGSAPPTVAGRTVFVASLYGVYALNADTGHMRWSYITAGTNFTAPAVANGIVYVASGGHKIYALQQSSGELLWSFSTGARDDKRPTRAGRSRRQPARVARTCSVKTSGRP